jgi:hypothetical protein
MSHSIKFVRLLLLAMAAVALATSVASAGPI